MVNKNNGPSKNLCNNDVTYADKWDTKQNRNYQAMALAIARKSDCCSSVPLSWAREVYFFLHLLESKYGIAYATSTMDGYYLPRGLKDWIKELFVITIKLLPRTLKQLYKDVFKEPSKWRLKHSPTRTDRVKETLFGHGGRSGYFYGWRALKHALYGRYYNRTKNPKVHLSQFKEKFGYVTVYFNASDEITKEVNQYIKKLEMSLSKKGAYYDLTKGKK